MIKITKTVNPVKNSLDKIDERKISLKKTKTIMLAKIRSQVVHCIKIEKFSHFLLTFVLPFTKNPIIAESTITIEQLIITAVNPIPKLKRPNYIFFSNIFKTVLKEILSDQIFDLIMNSSDYPRFSKKFH